MDNLELMKQEISNLAKEKKEEFEKVSDYIFANPELAFKEYKSQEALCKLLESHGFVVNEELQKCRRLLKQFLILENQGKQ